MIRAASHDFKGDAPLSMEMIDEFIFLKTIGKKILKSLPVDEVIGWER